MYIQCVIQYRTFANTRFFTKTALPVYTSALYIHMSNNQTPQLDIKARYKLACFEYMLDEFLEWDKLINGSSVDSPEKFTKLKVIKLNFFASAILSNKDNEGLLKIFDKFHAMKYGHVESDILSLCQKMDRYYFEDNILKKRSTVVDSHLEIEPADKKLIYNSIQKLMTSNEDLIKYTPSQLVNLSHLWYSWKSLFTQKRRSNSILIDSYIIRTEPKIFELSFVSKDIHCNSTNYALSY